MNSDLKIQLNTEVCDVVLSLREFYREEKVFNFDVKCIMAEKFKGFYPHDFFCSLHENDLKGLVDYFHRHCQGLRDRVITESHLFMPLEADFQLKAFDGEIENDDGYFTMLLLFNCGKANEGASNSYFGFETVVYLLSVNTFCDEVMALLARSCEK